MSFAVKPIHPKIQKILERRSKILSRDTSVLDSVTASNKSEALSTINSRTTWVRWISGDVNPVVILGGLSHFTGDDENLVYTLAKGFNDVYIPPGTSIKYHKTPMVSQENEQGETVLYDQSVRSGGDEMKPLAGVKSINSSFEGAQKSLRKVEVSWTVFDLDELEKLTPHFLSPGKWVMLEMGWNYNKKTWLGLHGDKLLNKNTKSSDFDSLEELIFANGGDYECITGVISNFEYSLRDDGGFDCTTTITTYGISLLDSTITSPPYRIDGFLDGVPNTDGQKSSDRSNDVFKSAVSSLNSFLRTLVTNKNNELLAAPDDASGISVGTLYGPDKLKYTFSGNSNFFLQIPVGVNLFGSETDNSSSENEKDQIKNDVPAWVRWGWFEDNIISKYLGFATFTKGGANSNELTVDDIKLQFRSIDDKLPDDINAINSNNTVNEIESVRINSHTHLLTTNVNKFILVGKTPTLEEDGDLKYKALGKFLNAKSDILHKFEIESGEGVNNRPQGYLRDVYFNVDFLIEKIKGTSTLRQAINSIWDEFNSEYQNFWDFKIVGDDEDLSIVRLVDINTSRYEVNAFKESIIDLNNDTKSKYGVYKFPTWTKHSIVKNMDYSVTIPSSQVAVAALSGGELSSNSPADRHKGDVSVQQYQKHLQKSFVKNKSKFFNNIERLYGKSSTGTFGNRSADETKKLELGSGYDIFAKLLSRKAILNSPGNTDSTVNVENHKYESDKIPLEYNIDPYFNDDSKSDIKSTLYEGGKLASLGIYEEPIKTMHHLLHGNVSTAKTTLYDLLNGISEIKLTIDGISGIYPGNVFTSAHLPNHLLRTVNDNDLPLLFQVTNVSHELSSDTWNTTLTGQPRLNSLKLYGTDKKPSEIDETPVFTNKQEFEDTNNILGMGGMYLDRLKMFNGIYLPLPSEIDDYFATESLTLTTTTEDVTDPRFKNNPPKILKRLPFLKGMNKSTGEKLYTKILPKADEYSFGAGRSAGDFEIADVEYVYGRNPIVSFKSEMSVEEGLWFSMYNGILFSIPPFKTIDKSKHGELGNLSEDGSFKNMSYHLFKGMPKSKPDIIRKMHDGSCDYTTEYKDVMRKSGAAFWRAPCEFYMFDQNSDLFTFSKVSRKLEIKNIDGVWFDKTSNLYQMKLNKNGKKQFQQFFKNMYSSFVGPELDLIFTKLKDKDITEANPVSNYLTVDEVDMVQGFKSVSTFNIDDEIKKFLDGMVHHGIIISPMLLYAVSEGLGYNKKMLKAFSSMSWQEDFFIAMTNTKNNYTKVVKKTSNELFTATGQTGRRSGEGKYTRFKQQDKEIKIKKIKFSN